MYAFGHLVRNGLDAAVEFCWGTIMGILRGGTCAGAINKKSHAELVSLLREVLGFFW